MFISQSPLHFDSGKFILTELAGKGKTEITLCLMDKSGNNKQIGSWTLNENKAEKKDVGQRINKAFSKAKGKFVIVKISGKSVSNRFQYRLRIKKAS